METLNEDQDGNGDQDVPIETGGPDRCGRARLGGNKGLTNLIWVWSVKDVNTSSFADYYPGSNYISPRVLTRDEISLGSTSTPAPTSTATGSGLALGRPVKAASTDVTAPDVTAPDVTKVSTDASTWTTVYGDSWWEFVVHGH